MFEWSTVETEDFTKEDGKIEKVRIFFPIELPTQSAVVPYLQEPLHVVAVKYLDTVFETMRLSNANSVELLENDFVYKDLKQIRVPV